MKQHPLPGAHTRARSLRQNMTEAEKHVWQILRLQQMQAHRFRRQVPLGSYIADFVCHDARLIIEIDGGQHDSTSPREIERSEFLQREGYCILRFWNNDVLTNLDGVHQTIAAALAHFTPSPSMGEGRGGGDPSESGSPQRRSRRITPSQPSPIEGEGF